LNISVWLGDTNLFFDAAEPSCIGAPLRCVAAALIELVGCETGSALPVAQSYSAETFARLRKGNSVLSPTAAIFGAKSAGSICKRSPDSIADNPGRAIEHRFDQLNDRSARLEIRVGEAGFSTGSVNPLASAHYVLLALLAVRNGMRSFLAQPDRAPTVDALFGLRQELDTSPEAAVTGFCDSELMKDGYGTGLHELIVRHATEVLGNRPDYADRVA
jgi:hypothetical protein